MEYGLEVKIWGTRGSLAAPYTDRMEFGGNSSCVSVRWEDQTVVFDCGTGLHGLGVELLQKASCDGTKEVHIFLSHVHLDHICALPFFPLLFRKDWKIHIYGCPIEGETFRETIGRVIQPPFWPITLEQAAAEIVWHDLAPNMCVELSGGVVVKTFRANHGPGALLYRLERDNVSMVYGLDHEVKEDGKSEYCEFVRGTDLLIFDGMYTEEEYVYCKGFGHSVWMRGAELAEQCTVDTVCISHHDWSRSDEQLEKLENLAVQISDHCVFAREGMVFQLTE